MNIPLIIGLFLGLIIFIIILTTFSQNKQKRDRYVLHEMRKNTMIIDSTEDIIGYADKLPFSKELYVCLHKRIRDGIQNNITLDKEYAKRNRPRLDSINAQIAQVESTFTTTDINSFHPPNNDRIALALLKLIKRLKNIVKAEHGKGNFPTQAYALEIQRLDILQTKINIENVIKRANDAIVQNQAGTAAQLLTRGINSISARQDSYSMAIKERLQEMLQEVENSQSEQQQQQIEELNKKDELDELFTPKKKW